MNRYDRLITNLWNKRLKREYGVWTFFYKIYNMIDFETYKKFIQTLITSDSTNINPNIYESLVITLL